MFSDGVMPGETSSSSDDDGQGEHDKRIRQRKKKMKKLRKATMMKDRTGQPKIKKIPEMVFIDPELENALAPPPPSGPPDISLLQPRLANVLPEQILRFQVNAAPIFYFYPKLQAMLAQPLQAYRRPPPPVPVPVPAMHPLHPVHQVHTPEARFNRFAGHPPPFPPPAFHDNKRVPPFNRHSEAFTHHPPNHHLNDLGNFSWFFKIIMELTLFILAFVASPLDPRKLHSTQQSQ